MSFTLQEDRYHGEIHFKVSLYLKEYVLIRIYEKYDIYDFISLPSSHEIIDEISAYSEFYACQIFIERERSGKYQILRKQTLAFYEKETYEEKCKDDQGG